ncbi:hypothetical protein RZS08_10445, partial [Arthrospira platensis SPKY1]|nr:hypothetical protein [Arthrospira platensis SPKY1]
MQNLLRPIRRTIVHDDQLDVGVALSERAVHRLAQVRLGVVAGHDDGDEGVVGVSLHDIDQADWWNRVLRPVSAD